VENDYSRILSQREIDGLFCLDNETLAGMLDEIIKELGYNPCVFDAMGDGQVEYREWGSEISDVDCVFDVGGWVKAYEGVAMSSERTEVFCEWRDE